MTPLRPRGSIARAVSLAFAVSVLFGLVASAVGIVFTVQAERSSDKALNTWIPAGKAVDQLFADMVDQETGERGYVITAQRQFLQPYTAGREATGPLRTSLGGELAGDPSDERLLSTAMDRYRDWLVGFAQPQINDVRRGDDSAAVAAEETGRGKALFDGLRHAFSALNASIDAKDAAAAARIRSLQSDVVWLIVAVLVCALAGALVGLAFLRRAVIRPILGLERVVASVSADEADRAIRPAGPREIASLAESVEAMRLRLIHQATELREERHVVRTLQEALLPRDLPRFANFDFAARYVPAASEPGIGGDWYNVREVDPQRLFVVVGDVAGRGLDAAALMASLRFAINAYAAEDPDPGRVLTRLSNLFELASQSRFATVVACLFDATALVVQVASAGHPSPIIKAPSGSGPIALTPGPPIGLGPYVYESERVDLPVGATVVLFSDGLVERRDESLEVSIERLVGDVPSAVSVMAMLDQLLDRRGSGDADDTIACGVRIQAMSRPVPDPAAALLSSGPG